MGIKERNRKEKKNSQKKEDKIKKYGWRKGKKDPEKEIEKKNEIIQ